VTVRRNRRLAAPVVAVGFALVVGALAAAPGAAPHPAAPTWPYTTLIDRISGARVLLGRRRIRVDGALVMCNGEGRPVTRGGVRRWRHFTCTQTLLTRNGVGRDVTFRVHVLGRTRFLVTNVRLGPG
jgi:hypothetical protein